MHSKCSKCSWIEVEVTSAQTSTTPASRASSTAAGLALSHEHDAYYFEPHLDEAANAVALHSGGKNSLAVQVLWQSRGRPGGAVKTPPFPDLIKKFCCLPE